MVNRRQETKVAITGSEQNRVSSPGEARPIEEARISAIYELTDIGTLPEDDAKKVLAGVDLLRASVTDLIREVQEQVEKILKS